MDLRVPPGLLTRPGAPEDRARANLEAVRLLRTLAAERRGPTFPEQLRLLAYTGWEGLDGFFDPAADPQTAALRQELQGLLSPLEFAAARAAARVPARPPVPEVVRRAIHDGFGRLGFPGGRLLDATAGIGDHLGTMPDVVAAASTRTALEVDPVRARLLRALYPEALVQPRALEDARLPVDHFDAAVAVLPEGAYAAFDPTFNPDDLHVGPYTAYKSLALLRPGGIAMAIAPAGLLDDPDPAAREKLAARAELLGAVRIPAERYPELGGSTVDVLFFRRRVEPPPVRPAWVDVAPGGADGPRNGYWIAHPEGVLDGSPLGGALAKAFEALPAGAYQGITRTVAEVLADGVDEHGNIRIPEGLREGSFFVARDELWRVEAGAAVSAGLTGIHADRVRGLVAIRDAVRALLTMEAEGALEAEIEAARATLNSQYDRFVARHGPINLERQTGNGATLRPNLVKFRHDPDRGLVMALEVYDPQEGRAEKAGIFETRQIRPATLVQRVETVEEALLVCLAERGRIDLARVAHLAGVTEASLEEALAGKVYRDPAQGGAYVPADEYLSGRVGPKLEIARQAAQTDPAYQPNVAALEAVQIKPLGPGDIKAALGVAWIPPSDVKAFLHDVLGEGPKADIQVGYLPSVGKWKVEAPKDIRESAAAKRTWGTDRVDALKLVELALNGRSPVVKDPLPGDKSRKIRNATQTVAAQDRQNALRERFASWVWQDPARAERLVRVYNELFNSVRARVYDGEYLTLPGSSASITLRQHQKNAVARGLAEPNTLLAHPTGSGKTWVYTAISQEARRLGMARKPVLTTPPKILGQFAREAQQLYPEMRLLMVGGEEMKPENRHRTIARMAVDDWDGMVISHTALELIPFSVDAELDDLREQKRGFEGILADKSAEKIDKKMASTALKAVEEKIRKVEQRRGREAPVTWEQLGVDLLCVDESDVFKSLVTPTTAQIGEGASCAADLFRKVRHIQGNGGKVVFGTATPISNTIAEGHVLQTYLQPEYLEETGLTQYSAWIATYGERVTAMELAPDGGSYRMNTRIAKYRNAPELVNGLRLVMDVVDPDELNIPKPDLIGGRTQTLEAPASPEQRAYVEFLVGRAENIHGGRVDPKADNMLRITTEGRLAALDMRCINPGLPDFPDSKVNRLVEAMHQNWTLTQRDRGVQVVFCDDSVPNRKGRFSVYEDIRQKLVRRHIPDHQIAFAQDANTPARWAALERAVREGRVRFLFASTLLLGVGSNVQDRLHWLWRLAPPWRPRDVTQQDGRILRQGNRFDLVGISNCVSRGTFDAYSYQILENKARFIRQVITSGAVAREIEDVDEMVLSYAEVKAIATGNPAIMEKARVDHELARLSRLERAHRDQVYYSQLDLARIPERLGHARRRAEALEADLARLVPTQADKFEITILGQHFRERPAAGEALRNAVVLSGFSLTHPRTHLGSFAGFDLEVAPVVPMIRQGNMAHSADLILRGATRHTCEVYPYSSGAGMLKALEHVPTTLAPRLQAETDHVARLMAEEAQLTTFVQAPFEHAAELERLAARKDELDQMLLGAQAAPDPVAAAPSPAPPTPPTAQLTPVP